MKRHLLTQTGAFNIMAETKEQHQQISIELGEKEAEGIYSNLAIISHSPAEFVVDFTRILPNLPKARVHARIIMTPQHAKLLTHALHDNIVKFEEEFGEIVIDGTNPFPGGATPIIH